MNNDATEPFKPARDDPFEDSYEWDYEEERTSQGILWGRVLVLAAMLVLAFVVGRATAPSGVPGDEVERLQNRLAASQAEVDRLEAEAEQEPQAQVTPTPGTSPSPETTEDTGTEGDTLVYTVKSGDSFADLAERFYQDATLDDFLAEANGLSVATPLKIGQELQIPPDPEP